MSDTATATRPKRALPILSGVLPVERSRIGAEAVAGVTLAALAIPEVMGYSNIAGMPVITGLYTLVLPLLVFAVFGSSRHLVVGADSATAAVMASGLAGLAATGSDEYVALAALLALMAGALMLVARLVRLGFIANFLSRTVLIGFLTGVGIQVALGQLGGMLGVEEPSGRTIRKFVDTVEEIPDTSMTTLAVSAGVIGTILGLKALSPKLPGALFAVVGAIVVSSAVDLASHGVSTLGKVPGGLPSLGFPSGLELERRRRPVPDGRLGLHRDPRPERRDVARLRGEVQRAASARTPTSSASVWRRSRRACRVRTWSTAARRRRRWSTVPAAAASSPSWRPALIVVVVLLFLTGPLQYMPERRPGVDRVPHRDRADRRRRDAQGAAGAARRVRRRRG